MYGFRLMMDDDTRSKLEVREGFFFSMYAGMWGFFVTGFLQCRLLGFSIPEN